MKKIQSLFLPAVAASILASGIARADNVFVVNNGGNSISEISNNTVTTFIPDIPGNPNDLNSPTGVAIFDNNFYVSNNGTNGAGFIAEFNSSGQFITDYSTGESGPRGLAFDSAGNLYVTNQSTNSIVEIPTGGGTGTSIVNGMNYGGVLNAPNGLAFDSTGNLYVTNGGGNTVDKIAFTSPGSGVVNTVAPFITAGLNSPNGIAFDSAGNLFVVDHGSNSVSEFTSTGAAVTPPPFIQQLSNQGPKTIAVNSAGDFYITDNTNNTVTEYNSLGVLQNTFSGSFNGPCFVTTQVVSVPEPSTYAFLVAGLGLLFFMSRRKLAMA